MLEFIQLNQFTHFLFMSFTYLNQPAIYILHDNGEWIKAISQELSLRGIAHQDWLLDAASLDLTQTPPQGVFWSKLSASSHSRGNPYAKEYARAILTWLKTHNKTVINGLPVLELEISKIAQYLALNSSGFNTPKTIASFNSTDKAQLAQQLVAPFIVKDNQGGKGISVKRFQTHAQYQQYLSENPTNHAIDGIELIQEYIHSKQQFITRLEFIGGKFHYAVKVDISSGSFELCPAQACQIDATPVQQFAAAACEITPADGKSLFSLREDIKANDDFITQLEQFLAKQRIDIVGIEFFDTIDDRKVIYDLNTNTNYNPSVEQLGNPAVSALADFLINQLNS